MRLGPIEKKFYYKKLGCWVRISKLPGGGWIARYNRMESRVHMGLKGRVYGIYLRDVFGKLRFVFASHQNPSLRELTNRIDSSKKYRVELPPGHHIIKQGLHIGKSSKKP